MRFTYLSTTAFLTILLIFSAPLMVMPQTAENEEVLRAKEDAKKDAASEVSSVTWFAAGFVGCIFGFGYALFYDPGIDGSKFIGKSPEYIMTYTNTYKSITKNKRLVGSGIGCVTTIAMLRVISIFQDND